IFLNATATELSDLDQKLQAFYHYLQKGVVESELAQIISESITTLKNNSLERRHYMTWAVKMADARYDGYDEGYEKGISVGLERGAYKKALETAKTMISIGLPEEQIQLCTNLPLETIRDLIQPEP
ncbi:MAG: hypothetical protein IKA80_02425, partial [Spirochaetaceae bacterium]|nr:hypothetical protein [Spirochaetaceae bacterium]